MAYSAFDKKLICVICDTGDCIETANEKPYKASCFLYFVLPLRYLIVMLAFLLRVYSNFQQTHCMDPFVFLLSGLSFLQKFVAKLVTMCLFILFALLLTAFVKRFSTTSGKHRFKKTSKQRKPRYKSYESIRLN